MPTNEEKSRVWQAYRDRKPVRVPLSLAVNPRVVLLDESWNPSGVTFEEYFTDPSVAIEIQRRFFLEYTAEYLNRYCDAQVGRPEKVTFYVDRQNIYDAAYFGAPIQYRQDQVPDVLPILAGADKDRIFDVDIGHPLDNPFVKGCLRQYDGLVSAARSLSRQGGSKVAFEARPPLLGFDGPLTIATCLRGQDVFLDLYEDPDYFHRLLAFIQEGVAIRNRALAKHFGQEAFAGPRGFLADDSVQLIATDTYARMVMPLHRDWYAMWSAQGPHSMHLCGDATRHFPLIHKELHVDSFDTGFPVDHGWLRSALGPDVEIRGGVEVSLLLNGSPQQVYDRAKAILESGVKAGGRFILGEANNLPPKVPAANLEAMYRACLEWGVYVND